MRSSRPLVPTAALGAAALLGLGIAGLAATPAYAATVSDTAALNDAIAANDPQITIGGDFTLTADIADITYDVQIIGDGHTIDADGYDTFDFFASATVTGLTVTDFTGVAYYANMGAGDSLILTDSGANAGVTGVLAYLPAGASVSIAGGLFADLGNRGILIDDEAGDAAVTITGTAFDNVWTGIDVDDLYGTSTVGISDVTITDAEYGIDFSAADDATGTVTGATITAGTQRNAGGIGYGVNANVYEGAAFTFDSGSIIGDPDGARFYDGVYTYQYDAGSVTISNSTITGHQHNVEVDAYDADTSLSVLRSVLTAANYSGIYFCDLAGTALIDETTIAGNGRDGSYAGIETSSVYYGADLTISRSTISGNTEGGIQAYVYDGSQVTIVNSTISGNDGDGDESAISFEGDGGDEVLWLLDSTVTANSNVAAALTVEDAIASVQNSIVSGNDTSIAEVYAIGFAEVYVSWSLLGSSDGDADSSIMGGDGVIVTNAPGLGPLANNGGPTLTHALLSGSPAYNAGNPDFELLDPPATDQRGQARIQNGRVDIGAVEMAPALPATGLDATPFLLIAGALALLGAALVVIRRTAKV